MNIQLKLFREYVSSVIILKYPVSDDNRNDDNCVATDYPIYVYLVDGIRNRARDRFLVFYFQVPTIA